MINTSIITSELINYVSNIGDQISSSARALYLIRNNKVVTEWYSGTDANPEARYNVYSVRKSYTALAAAIALHASVRHCLRAVGISSFLNGVTVTA